jgi:hypothetical protein
MPLDSTLAELPGFTPLREVGSVAPRLALPDEEYRAWLQENNGAYAFGGCLRLFPTRSVHRLADIDSWNDASGWKRLYGKLSPSVAIFAEDVFGLQFGFDQKGTVTAFWSETGEVEDLGYGLREFLARIVAKPEETISYDTFQRARKALGSVGLHEHLACRVETALGGRFDVENLVVMNAYDHMVALGKIAVQLRP